MIKKISLTECREKIDIQDEIIINALNTRFDVVAIVKNIKNQHTTSPINLHFNIKREYSIIANLIKKTQLPFDIIYGIWRNIISYANKMEQKIDIIYNTEEAHIEICKFYPAFCDTKKTNNIINAILKPKNAVVGAFNLKDFWWYDIFVIGKPAQDNLRIFNIVNGFAFIGYINDEVLCDKYFILTLKTKDMTKDMKILSQYKDMSLVATQDKNLISKPIGLVNNI